MESEPEKEYPFPFSFFLLLPASRGKNHASLEDETVTELPVWLAVFLIVLFAFAKAVL